jgi:hypothetical protein
VLNLRETRGTCGKGGKSVMGEWCVTGERSESRGMGEMDEGSRS